MTGYPLVAVYSLVAFLNLIGKLPFWLLRYSVPSSRPHSSWTLNQTLRAKLIKTWLEFASSIEFQFPQSLSPGAEKERWVVIPPKDSKFYQPPLDDRAVKPAKIGGFWYPGPYLHETDQSRKVILHIHGGAFVISDAREMNYGFAAKSLHDATSATIFFPDYRLSSTKGNRFPAALQDSLTAYLFLLDQGVPRANIILSGDSAGANLAIGLLRFFSQNINLFPTQPYALLLWSPWLDLSMDFDELFTRDPRANTDYVPAAFLEWGRRAYKPSELSASDSYISPGQHPFTSKTPIWIHLGGLEIFKEQITAFHRAMREIGNSPVVLDEMENEVHDVLMLASVLGKEQQGREAATQAANFIDSLGE